MPGSIEDFVQNVISPVLVKLDLDRYRAEAAAELLLGTALQESGLIYRQQLDGGPALGLFQMEPATHDDIWANFLHYRPLLARIVGDLGGGLPASALLETDDSYAAAMCRVHYLRMGQIVGQLPLPDAGDIPAMGDYWKRFYNTAGGAGAVSEFVANWQAHHATI